MIPVLDEVICSASASTVLNTMMMVWKIARKQGDRRSSEINRAKAIL